MIDLAARSAAHNWRDDGERPRDPIVRSLLDTDFYKLLMLQFVWLNFRGTRVKYGLINRTASVKLAEVVDRRDLVRQLDWARTLSYAPNELVWLAGNTFYGKTGIFRPEFIEWLRGYRLPAYRLGERDGQWTLEFEGAWEDVMLWETIALSILSELRTRAGLSRMDATDIDLFFSGAKRNLWKTVSAFVGVPGLMVSDMSTRRRFSFLWQEYMVRLFAAKAPGQFSGTSNALIAMRQGLNAVGTNAHEQVMVLTALAEQGRLAGIDMRGAQWELPRMWRELYPQALSILLPDTYGSDQFFEGAPSELALSAGVRADSGDPFAFGEDTIRFYCRHGQDARGKLFIASDGLDRSTVLRLHATFGGVIQPGHTAEEFRSAEDFLDASRWRHEPRIRDPFGMGGNLGNDMAGACTVPGLEETYFRQISIVCKVVAVEGRPAVKLSNNPLKATGPREDVERYLSVFGSQGMASAPVLN